MTRELDAIVRTVLRVIECPTGGAVRGDPQTQLLLTVSLVGFSDEQIAS
jgi:hypothetical protein